MIFGFISIVSSVFVFWFAWWPLRSFFTSLIPANAQYAWVGELIISGVIAWFGGIFIPLVLIVLGLIGICANSKKLSRGEDFPKSPNDGQMFYNTEDDTVYMYNKKNKSWSMK